MYRAALIPLSRFYKFWLAALCGAILGLSVNAAETEYRFIVKKGDTLSSYFSHLGISKQILSNMLAANKRNESLNHLSIGHSLTIGLDKNKHFDSLSYDINRDNSIKINKSGNYFVTKTSQKNKSTSLNSTTITINRSLSYDAKQLNIDPSTVNTIVRAFAWNINFNTDLRKGDKFIVVKDSGKAPVALIYKGHSKNIALFSYKDEFGNVDYYNQQGLSVRPSFLTAPLKFDRISSRFKKSRYHPILKTWKPHRAVDFSAKTGTPVYSTADGIIKHTKKDGALGNVVYIQHGNDHVTVYAHLLKFANGLRKNAKVSKGQTIGYVGSSGRSTGPHLHYELRYKGERKDPLKYNMTEKALLKSVDLALFKRRASSIINSL